MDTITLFISTDNCKNLLNNSKKIWKPNRKNNPTYYYAKYNEIYFKYIPENYYLSMKFSITKFLYGKNTCVLVKNDLTLLFDLLNKYASAILNNVPDVQEWKINRIDLAHDYYCASPEDKQTYIDAFKKLKYSRYKSNKNYKTSVHKHNKSFVYNIYDKSAQNPTANKHILRVEFQYKNPAIKAALKKGTLSSKTFGIAFSNLDELTEMYKSKLLKLGLQNRFLTTEEMSVFLNNLLYEEKISDTLHKNMCAYFVEESKSISAGTLYKYKKELSKHGIHHIKIDNELDGHVDFMDFNLYKEKDSRDSIKANSMSLFVMALFLLIALLLIDISPLTLRLFFIKTLRIITTYILL